MTLYYTPHSAIDPPAKALEQEGRGRAAAIGPITRTSIIRVFAIGKVSFLYLHDHVTR